MTIIYRHIPGAPLAPEQLERLNALEDRPVAFDDDCPELTPETEALARQAVRERNKRLVAQGIDLDILRRRAECDVARGEAPEYPRVVGK